MKYRTMFCNPRFGQIEFVSYFYYLLYELFSPIFEVLLGLIPVLMAWWLGALNVGFMIRFFLFYAIYGAVLTMAAFFQRIYTQNLKIKGADILKACLMCVVENVFFRFVLDFVRATAFIGYRKRKNQWGQIKRQKHSEAR